VTLRQLQVLHERVVTFDLGEGREQDQLFGESCKSDVMYEQASSALENQKGIFASSGSKWGVHQPGTFALPQKRIFLIKSQS